MLLLLFTGFTSVIQSNNEHDIVYSSGKNKSVKSPKKYGEKNGEKLKHTSVRLERDDVFEVHQRMTNWGLHS
ncbi:hypothetical protein HMPREF7215_2831 [Pyramidobacter piscolens W5455]|uniref:Uncharacterized protein n=1 Tax=Pyramidobacter piscolens W5455 TaxID=352165 RepID=A0ABM9ZXH2_9BACT|nr:hypothetical protein HMPREF7215_2831 [Pyramidobacter piscolens W5455]BDF78314.1 hypothetical protein CE91St28_11080 [Pyramidobacter piscolens]